MNEKLVEDSNAAARLCERAAMAKGKNQAEVALACLRELEALPTFHGDPGPVMRYLQLRLAIQAGQVQRGRKGLMTLVSTPSVAPEAICALEEIAAIGKDNKKASTLYLLHGQLLPMSGYGRAADAQAAPVLGPRSRRHRPRIPSISQDAMIEIADGFYRMRMWAEAAGAYTEAIYSAFAPTRVLDDYAASISWLSGETGPLWLKAAEAEKRLSHGDQAVQYALKTVLFGGPETRGHALAAMEMWSGDKPDANPEASSSPQPDGKELKRIAERYVEMNMHPRAIRLVRAHRASMGVEAGSLEKRYGDAWLALLKEFCGDQTGKCVLFGQDVLPEASRLGVTIPPTCSLEAVKTVAQQVAKEE